MADLKTQFGFTDSLFAAINEVRASATSVAGADEKLKEDVYTADFKIGKDGRKVRAHRVVTTDKTKEVEEEKFDPLKHVKNPTSGEKKAAKDVKRSSYADRAAMLKSAQADGRLKEDAEEVEEESHQSKTTMKHINNPNDAEKKAAKDIKPGIKGVKDRLDMLKAAKARGALKEEELEESFSTSQIAALKAEYSKINGIDPSSDNYKKLIAMLDKLDLASLKSLAGADIKFVSGLAKNRVMRKSVKEEVESLDELSKDTLKSYAKKAVGDLHKQGVKKNDQKAVARYKGLHKAVDKLSEEDVEIEEGTGNLKPSWMLKKDPELAKKVKEKQDLAKKREASYGDKSAGKSVAEGIMDKIKAVKRGMDAKAKAADHFDKAGDPKNPNKSKDLKRAVKYHNLVNKEEVESDEIGILEAVETSKVPVGSRPKGIGWALHRAGKQHNEPHDTYKRTTKQVASSSAKNEEVKVGEELSPAQKAIDKNKNGKIDGQDLAAIRNKKKPQGADFAAARRKERMASNGRMDEEVKVGDKVSFDHEMKAIPGKTMKKVGTVHKVEDGTVHIKVKDKYGVITHKKSASELTKEEFESIDEAPKYDNKYTIYHKDYSSAVQHAAVHAGKQGYEIDHDDWDRVVAMGPKKPSAGKTNILNVSLKKDGKESKKKLHMQVYNMDNKGYELNTYVEEVQLDELNKDTVYSYAKKSEKDQDDQFDKIGKGIRDKDPKSANKASHKFSMRSVGQNRAEKRLNKEEASESNVSVNEAAKQPTKRFKDMKKKNTAGTKSEEGTSKKGEPLSGKKEAIEVNPELHKNQK